MIKCVLITSAESLDEKFIIHFSFHSTNTYATFIYIQYGYTHLHWASLNGQTDIVERLLKAGANPDAVTKVSCMVCTELVYSSGVYPEKGGGDRGDHHASLVRDHSLGEGKERIGLGWAQRV